MWEGNAISRLPEAEGSIEARIGDEIAWLKYLYDLKDQRDIEPTV